MKAGVIVTGTGAILVLTACDSFEDPQFTFALRQKGISRYIALEVPMDMVHSIYEVPVHFALTDPRDTSQVCKVIDVDGSRIFRNFPMNVMGRPVCHDDEVQIRKAA